MKPHLAITMGDPAGVGPEIIVKACLALKDRIEAGKLGKIAVDGDQVLLGKPLVFTKENIDQYDF